MNRSKVYNPVMPAKTLNLIGRSGQQLKETLESIGVGKEQLDFRAAQLWKGIYRHGVKDFDSMPNLGRGLQEQLAEHCTLARGEIISEQTSADGTRKWLIRFAATEEQDTSVEVETVYIPETNRGTLCVSSQVGCSLSCPFCHTGTQKMVRNLTAAEILMQIMVARDQLDDFRHQSSTGSSCLPHSGRRITNIVMMGMGEPLFNFENVKQALLIALDQAGLSFSRRRVTLSTAGVVPGIARTGHEIRVALAISLHAVNDGLRDRLVPINRKYPLAQLVDACRRYPGLSNSRRITFEYVMLKGINDSIADARELIRLLADIPAKINLIPFNPWPGTDFECSEQPVIERFASRLQKNGFLTPIRIPRGDDILAACGQLKSVSKGMENVISL